MLDWNQPVDTFPEQFPYYVRDRDSLRANISRLFNTEVTMYDGAMGTMIQKKSRWLDEAAFRGERFADWTSNDKDNHDLLSLSHPQAIKNFYLEYLRSGSRLIGTNTFSSTTIAQADYLMEGLAYELNSRLRVKIA
jgi:5-methyltetrahydrofolate--homocysteine methyltransferase